MKIKLQKNITAAQARDAVAGQSFVLDGHRAGCGSTLLRFGKTFHTNMGYLVIKPSIPPVRVTVVTVK